jgi:hypothetical protein
MSTYIHISSCKDLPQKMANIETHNTAYILDTLTAVGYIEVGESNK